MLSIQSSTSRPHPFAELSFTLFDTLDFENRLMKAVRFAVGNFCDWCSVEIIDKNGVNQTRVVLPREDGNELPERTLVQEVVHLTSIDDTTLHSHFDSQDERTFFKSLGSKSLIILPLSARGSVFGNITFIS